MASGLPVIATNVGGNPELVEENINGTLVPPSDPYSLAEAIKSYIGNTEKLESHGHAGRKKVKTSYSLGNMVNKYLDIYNASLNQ